MITPPVLIYLAMGLLVARIELEGIRTRSFRWLQWLQFLVDALRIVLLWPLVLLFEKVGMWLKAGAEDPTPFLQEPQEKHAVVHSGVEKQ